MELAQEKYIVKTDGIRGGKAHLANTRITVSDIVARHFRLGQSLEEIAVKYDLSFAALHAALSYYFDNKTDIDRELDKARTEYDTIRQTAPSRLREKLPPQDD